MDNTTSEDVSTVTTGSARAVTDFSSYCEGDIEPTLNKRIHTSIDANQDYIVYLDDDLSVEWSMTEAYDQHAPEGFGEIASRTGHLETLSMVLLDSKQIEPFRRLLAEGMARVIGDKDLDKARESIGSAEGFLKARSLERARIWYLLAPSSVAGLAILLAALLWLARDWLSGVLGVDAFQVGFGSLVGAVGALTAALKRAEDITMDASAGVTIHRLEGAARIVMGIAGALLIALAVKANVVLGFTKTSDHSLAFLLAACFVAGWSEKFVPSLIKRFENSTSGTPQMKPSAKARKT